MAGIGLYGIYYSKATLTDGVVQGYTGANLMGKAISANFEPADAGENNLWANNAIAETDTLGGAGGTLTITTDKISDLAHQEIFGLTQATKAVTVGSTSVVGTGYDDTINVASNAVGVAFIRWKQENNDRGIYEAVIFSHCIFKRPAEESSTYSADNGVEWQTPELEATVNAGPATGTYPWRQRYTFPTQEAAIQYITDVFAAPSP